MSGEDTITLASLDKMAKRFESDPINEVMTNVVQLNGVRETSYSKAVKLTHDKGWTHKLALEGKATSQRQSGRCWLFAACNILRQPIMRAFGLTRDWEISQTWLFFWDKLEKANWALQVLIDTVDSDPDQCAGRLWSHVLATPQQDGGQYTMFLDIILKHGIVPKSVYHDASGSMRSQPLNWLVNNKLREAGWRIKQLYLHHAGPAPVSPEAHAAALVPVRAYAQEVVSQIHHILSTALGAPPKSFEWRVEDGGHGRTITPAHAARVAQAWGEDLAPAETPATAAATCPAAAARAWTPLEFLRLVVQPCVKHGWAEKHTVGKLCIDSKSTDAACPASALSPAPAAGSPAATPATPRGEGVEGDERQEELSQLSRPVAASSPADKPAVAAACCPRGLGPGPAGSSAASTYLSGFISLVNDPRHEYWRTYTVAHLGSVRGGDHPVLYVNVPSDVLLRAIAYTICRRGRPVWFGCDAGKYTDREHGLWDPAAFKYASALGTNVGAVGSLGETSVRGEQGGAVQALGGVYGKRERVLHGESLMTHAMVFSGLDARTYPPAVAEGSRTEDHQPKNLAEVLDGPQATEAQFVHRLRVENSWGEDKADKGYHSISFQYFNEFCYQAVVHKDDMETDMRSKVEDALKTKPTVMPLWDPMGALAM